MTSNATFTGIAVGQKSGKGLVFNLKERDQDEEGKELDISARSSSTTRRSTSPSRSSTCSPGTVSSPTCRSRAEARDETLVSENNVLRR